MSAPNDMYDEPGVSQRLNRAVTAAVQHVLASSAHAETFSAPVPLAQLKDYRDFVPEEQEVCTSPGVLQPHKANGQPPSPEGVPGGGGALTAVLRGCHVQVTLARMLETSEQEAYASISDVLLDLRQLVANAEAYNLGVSSSATGQEGAASVRRGR
jgi:hypothetical protein